MTTETHTQITVRVARINHKPRFAKVVKNLKNFGGRFDGETKTWTVPVKNADDLPYGITYMVREGEIEILEG